MNSECHNINPPKVSVLLPVYNAASTLPEALESITNQTYADFEVIAIDDGSTDESVRILQQQAESDRRIRVWSLTHRGLVDCLNFGLKQCHGALIARMDADDLMMPERLQKQLEYLEKNPRISLVSCQVEMLSEQPIRDGWREYLEWQNRCLSPEQIANEIYWEAPFVHPAVMFCKQEIIDIGGYLAGDFPEDYELWLRMNASGLTMAKIPEMLLQWREHPAKLTHTDSRYSVEGFSQVRFKYLLQDPRIRSAKSIVVWGAGRKTRKRLKPFFESLFETGISVDAWVDIDTAKIGNQIAGAPVWAAEALKNLKPKPLVLAAVRNHGAKELIEQQLEAFGYRAGINYLPIG